MGNGETILIVDDVKLQRKVATDNLSKLGYDLVTISRGETAISSVKNHILKAQRMIRYEKGDLLNTVFSNLL